MSDVPVAAQCSTLAPSSCHHNPVGRPDRDTRVRLMPIFLFAFGYETPSQHLNNKANGWDDEDSEAVFIDCPDPDAALAWGCEVAEVFVRRLWKAYGEPGPSWKDGRFAYWIETSPEVIARARASGISCLQVGDHPM